MPNWSSSTGSGPTSPGTIWNLRSGSTTAATAGMAPLAEGARPAGGQSGGQGLATRMVSAAVLLPLAIGAVWLGGTWWAALVGVFAVAMAWEWSHVCAPSKHGAI